MWMCASMCVIVVDIVNEGVRRVLFLCVSAFVCVCVVAPVVGGA